MAGAGQPTASLPHCCYQSPSARCMWTETRLCGNCTENITGLLTAVGHLGDQAPAMFTPGAHLLIA